MTGGGDTENNRRTSQRVTNATIAGEIKYLTKIIENVDSQQKTLNILQLAANKDQEDRIRALEGNQRSIITSIENLDTRVKTWGSINSLGVIFAGVLAAFGIKQQ